MKHLAAEYLQIPQLIDCYLTQFKILRPNTILNVDSYSCVLLEQSLLNCSALNLMFILLTLKAYCQQITHTVKEKKKTTQNSECSP